MSTVHGISNVKDIAILSYDSKDYGIIISAEKFLSSLGREYGNDVDNRNSCTGDKFTPKKAYEANIDLIYGKCDDNCIKNHGAWHSNGGDLYKGCTRFYNLYGDDRMTIEKNKLSNMRFKIFDNNKDSPRNWIVQKRSDRYDVYWRVYYRTWEDYLNYIRCNKDNLNLNNYKNNINECKTYIDNNNKQQWIANTCVRENISENDLFDICNRQLLLNNVNNDTKKDIIKKQIEFCKKGENLKDDNNCRKFWGLDYNEYYTQTDKFNAFEKDDWIKNTHCSKDHNNYPFCNCINNEKNTIQYTDANGQKIKVPDLCLLEQCSSNSYRPSNYKDYSCPSQCIQIAEAKYAVLKDVKQSCTINKSEQNKTTDKNELPDDSPFKDEIHKEENQIKSSLFNFQNDNIKNIMKNANIKFPIEFSNYLLNEEDIFILGIIFLFIFIIIISKVFGGNSEQNYSDYPNEMYYDTYPNQMYYDTYPN